VNTQLKAWGIEIGKGSGGMGHGGFWDALTDAQKTELQAMIEDMKGRGATREEIGQAVKAKLAEWGIVIGRGKDGGGMHGGFWDKLTDAQKAQLQALIDQWKSEGNTAEQIREKVNAQLKEWGIDLGRGDGGKHGMLTPKQQAILHEMVTTMQAEGKTREEIQTAILAQLKAWGIEPGMGGGMGGGRKGIPNKTVTIDPTVTDVKNFPNPFNPSTTISFTLTSAQVVTANVYNESGQLIRTLVNGTQPAGQNFVTWNGIDDGGTAAASGVYMLRIEAGGYSQTQQMILMK